MTPIFDAKSVIVQTRAFFDWVGTGFRPNVIPQRTISLMIGQFLVGNCEVMEPPPQLVNGIVNMAPTPDAKSTRLVRANARRDFGSGLGVSLATTLTLDVSLPQGNRALV